MFPHLCRQFAEYVRILFFKSNIDSSGQFEECYSLFGIFLHISLPSQHLYPLKSPKQSDGEVPVMLELWGMWSIPSLLSLPGPLWPGVV